MKNSRPWSTKTKLLVLVILGLALLAIYYAQSHYFQRSPQHAQIQHVTCNDLVQGCDIDGINIKFDHQPEVMLPFHLRVQTTEAKNIHATFAMPGMQMGLNRYRLLQQTPDTWNAEIILPICIQARIDWLLEIEITNADLIRRYQLSFTSNAAHARLPRPE